MIKSIMKVGITRILFGALLLAAGITYITWSFQSASITKARSLLQEALDRIETPAAGQIAYYTYQQFRRGPDPALEPPDPYHKPYSAIWHNAEQIETWLEVGLDGKTTRWRTQSRDEDGTLLQDLYFDGAVETDYYPLDEFAEKFPMEAVDYPLYGLESSAVPFKLVSANLKPLETSYKSSSFRRGLNFAAHLGIGPMIEYANSDGSMRLRVIQGPKKIMQETFLQTLPDWVKSTQIQVRLGHKDVTGWNLINPQSNLVRIVLETGETVIYVEGEGIQFDQLVQLLRVFEVLG